MSAKDSSNVTWRLIKKLENKKKSLEFFKSGELRKTIQLHGWQSIKNCKYCEVEEKHHGMNSVLR